MRLGLKFLRPFIEETTMSVDIVATVDVSSLPASAANQLIAILSAAAGQWLSNYGLGNSEVAVTVEAPGP